MLLVAGELVLGDIRGYLCRSGISCMLALCPTARPLVLQNDGELFVPVAHGCALLVIFLLLLAPR